MNPLSVNILFPKLFAILSSVCRLIRHVLERILYGLQREEYKNEILEKKNFLRDFIDWIIWI